MYNAFFELVDEPHGTSAAIRSAVRMLVVKDDSIDRLLV